MGTKKTQQEVNAEIQALREIKPRVRRYSAFGDDNHAAIDLQIRVLSQGLTDYDIMDYEGDDYHEAVDAIAWRDGTDDEITSLVWEWQSLAK